MTFKVSDENKQKLKLIAVTTGLLMGFFVFFKYIVPLVWPLLLSLGLAVCVYPLVNFLHTRCRINKMLGLVVIMLVFIGGIGFLCTIILQKLADQITMFVQNIDYYQVQLQQATDSVCMRVERVLHLEQGYLGEVIYTGVNDGVAHLQENMMQSVVGKSLPAIKTMLDIIITVAIVLVALVLIVKDMEGIREKAKNSVFRKELSFLYHKITMVLKAYVKAQLIIMTIVAGVSILGLTIAGNDYSWLLGILVGVLDALPLLGAGMVLIPITLYYVIQQEMLKAAIVFTTFIACYFLREFLEPKLMGEKMGVGPIVTLLGIYTGYRLFGFLGMFAGAFVVILVTDVVKRLGDKS